MPRLTIVLIATLFIIPAFADEGGHQHQQHQHEMAAGGYGTVHFATSCSAAVQPSFQRAVAMLHSFGYEAARKAFEDVAQRDPDCAIAWWGVAMTEYHGLWAQISPAEGKAAIKKARGVVKKDPAKANPKTTARERGYIEALGNIYDDTSLPLHTRELAYEQAMAKLHADFPDDTEAAIFYALALDVTASPTDKTYANQRRARDILVPLFKKQPEHPGLAHYIIHVSDYPPLAADALPAARRYAKIAPGSAHAQHMPSHIFTRLGLWDESIASNTASAASAERVWQETKSAEAFNQRLHALDYLEYAYLQQGRDVDARAVVATAKSIREAQPLNNTGGYADAAIPARFAVERGDWEAAAALPDPAGESANDAITWYAKGLGAGHTIDVQPAAAGGRDAARVRVIVGKLAGIRDGLAKAGNQYWSNQVEIQRLQVLAWAEGAEQDVDGALRDARAAADLEDATEKAPVTPGPVLPARENLAQMYMVMGKGKSAIPELEKVLETSPGRLAPTVALAKLFADSNDQEKAMRYRTKLNALKHGAGVKTASDDVASKHK